MLALLEARAARVPNRTAFRYKARGLWHDVTWQALYARVADLAVGLSVYGIEPGTNVAILGEVSPAWIVSVLGLHCAGSQPLLMYPRLDDLEVGRILTTHRVPVLVADGPEQLGMLTEQDLPTVGRVLMMHEAAPVTWRNQPCDGLDALERSGQTRRGEDPQEWQALAERSSDEDAAMLFCTAESANDTRLAAHRSRDLIDSARALSQAIHPAQPIRSTDTTVVELPSGHPGAFVVTIVLPLIAGLVAHLPERLVAEAIKEVRPTVSVSFSAPWEMRAARMRSATLQTTGVKAWALRAAESAASRAHNTKRLGRRPSPVDAFREWLAYTTVLWPLLRKLGLERTRVTIVIGRLAPEIIDLWQCWGVTLQEVYGTVETRLAVARVEGERLVPLPGVALRVDAEGFLSVNYQDACVGVRDTARFGACDVDASEVWLRTPDVAATQEAACFRIGRREDLAQASSGKLFSLARIDAALRSSTYIRAAAALERSPGELMGVLDLDFDSVSRWANSRGISFRTPAVLRASNEVLELIAREIDRINEQLADEDLPCIKSFVVSDLRFEVGRELSPTWEVRREGFSADAAAQLTAEVGT